MSIGLKEANETLYWINLLNDTKYIDSDISIQLITDCNELIAMLVSTIKTSKKNLED